MLFKNIFIASLLSCFAVSSFAEVISGASTVSASAKSMEVLFTLNEAHDDCYANVYESTWPNTHLYFADVKQLDEGLVYSAKATIPDWALEQEKTFVISCGGESLCHKVVRPPKIRLAANVEYDENGELYFLADSYIENQEAMGKCWTNQSLSGFDLLGLHGRNFNYFRADHFIQMQALDEGYDQPIYLSVFCQNSGGVTRASQAWMVDENGEWQLQEYSFTYQ